MRRILSFIVILSLMTALFAVPELPAIRAHAAKNVNGGTLNSATFILDPGHGGSDPGAMLGTREEADDVLRLSLRIAQLINSAGETCALTRTTDVFLELQERCDVANAGSFTYFLSVHRNAGGGKGIETYYYSGSSATGTGAKLASSVQSSMVNSGIWTANRGVKTASYYVLKYTNMAAALVEVGFIDSTVDNGIFDANFETLALSIANGLLAMVGKSVDSRVQMETGEYTMQSAVTMRSTASGSGTAVVTVPAGEVLSVTEVVDKVYGYTQYGDYKGYIELNSLVKRTGGLNMDRLAAFSCSEYRYADQDYVVSWDDIPGAAGFACKVIQLNGEPDPGNSEESANGTVLYDSTAYVTQERSVRLSAAAISNGKYLKIAVRTTYPTKTTWASLYVTPLPIPFTDIAPGSWMYEPVCYCYSNGLMSGVSSSTFVPGGEVTLAMLIVTAYRIAGQPQASADAVMPYEGVEQSAYYYNALLWCVENNVVRISETPAFNANESVTRETAILYFYRMIDAIGKNDKVLNDGALDGFSDLDSINNECMVAMQWAVGKGLIGGSDGKLNPDGITTRAQLAVMLRNVNVHVEGVSEYYFPLCRGDIDNNGQIDAADYMSLKLTVKGASTVGAVFFETADWNMDGDISSADLFCLISHIKSGKN